MGEDLFDTTDQPGQTTITVDGTDQPVHDGTTPADLKTERENVAEEGQFTYRGKDDTLHSIPDDEPVLKHVEPGQSVVVQPVKGDVFGTPGYSTV